MTELTVLFFTLVVLLIVLAIWAVIGHVLWQMGAWTIRQMLGRGDSEPVPTIEPGWQCLACDLAQPHNSVFCGRCGRTKPTGTELELLKDLGATERQLGRFLKSNKITSLDFDMLLSAIHEAREILAGSKKQSANPSVPVQTETSAQSSLLVQAAQTKTTDHQQTSFSDAAVAPKRDAVIQQPRPPRRSFAEVLNTFMEQSNIRWGEIIGGLLIIGCSTALTVSLWAEISQTPVLKFLIFTTVTAVLFGIGLYTEHRWKLPTTSRGILTIATLLVPLNFLAIAAVSSGTATGALVIGSELLAPAIFLCLVYFAGRVIAPGCAGILSAGILASSVGQLFVRHFVSAESGPALLVFVGAFPVLCYITTIVLALRKVLADREIDERDAGTVFTMLGTMSFAALLPFGLLLYKAGPVGMSMMYLAPIVTLWGLPMLTTGTVLWRMIKGDELAPERTAGTALAIIGTLIVLSGMVLAWPNPASIVPTALINFGVFVALAFILELPAAHLIAATCFALAYLVSFHVAADRSPWLNLRVTSLLQVTLSAISGQALAAIVVFLLGVSEWLSRRGRSSDSHHYLIATCGIAVVSLLLLMQFGLWYDDPFIWPVLGLYSVAAGWIASRKQLRPFGWIGSALLLLTISQAFAQSQTFDFPWQTALFVYASICALVAHVSRRFDVTRLLSPVFSISTLLSSCVAIVLMLQANPWQTTASQAGRVFWLSGIWLSILWLHRSKPLFTAFQIALTAGVVLGVKATLQHFEWCDYLPHAFLHPWALQIQGTALVLVCLAWATLRMRLRNTSFAQLVSSGFAFDRVVLWSLLPAFWLFVTYGALSGLDREMFSPPAGYAGINIANFPHEEVLGPGSWILLAFLVLTMLVTVWERRSGKYLVGAMTVICGALPLIAGQFESDAASATALRWGAAFFFVGSTLAISYRGRLGQLLRAINWPELDANPTNLVITARALLFAFTIIPMSALTAVAILFAFSSLGAGRPTAGLFSRIDTNVSHAIPFVLVSVALIVSAVHERKTKTAIFAGCFLNVAATVAYLLSITPTERLMDQVIFIRTIQLNAIVASAYGIVSFLYGKRKTSLDVDNLLKFETAIGLALNAILIVPLTVAVVFGVSIAAGPVVGDLVGLVAFSLSVIALFLLAHAQKRHLSIAHLASLLLATCSLIAVANSRSLQVLTVGCTLISWLILSFSEFRSTASGLLQKVFAIDSAWEKECRIAAAVCASLGALLSIRLLAEPNMNRWWSVLPLLATSALFVLLHWKTFRRECLYAAGLLLNIAVWTIFERIIDVTFASSIEVNVIAWSLASIGWLVLELRARNAGRTNQPALSVHNVGAILSLVALTFLVAATFILGADGLTFDPNPTLIWVALGSTLLLLIAVLWDKHARYSVASLYLLGLLALALGLRQLDLPYTRMAWSAAIGLSIFALASSLLWRSRQKLLEICQRLGIPARISSDTNQLPWLMAFNAVAVATVMGIAYWIELRFVSFNLRTTVALAVIAQSLTFGLFAEGKWREHWQRASIMLFVAGTILMGWAFLTPGVTATWLNRSVILMVETFALTALYGWGLAKAKALAPEWVNAARSCMPSIVGAGVIALMFCLATEVSYQINFGVVRIHSVSLFAIGLTLVIAIVVGVLFAVSPAHDPLNLSESGRTKYVYAAEVMLALLFLHIRLTLPWLFTGFFEQYWPVVIMSIAYFGIVASEALRRRNLLTVAQPLERTGAFLPFLPVLGFWLAKSEVDYSALLFIVGGLYGLLSILRRSFGFGILAAVAGNGGLWYMLHRTGDYGFFAHPQLWLIPVALSVLLAAYLNEDRLNEDQMTGIRYLSLVTVYASSTADIFINGVENSPWLPLILGAFALAGVFSGIIFRIRGLLLLGSVFLLLSIVTMIWYASANMGWTWLWYVAGIVTGATIIFMFAMFEKKRTEVLRVVEGFREWEP